MAPEFLLEIGTEEIPARFIPPVLEEMAASFKKRLEQERIAVGEVLTWGTPRRLTLVAKGMAGSQADVTQEVVGPPKAVAYDAAGKPTAALLGFAKAQGVALVDLMEVETPRGVYLAVLKRSVGLPTRERLSRFLPEFILGLSFPKSMRWGDLDVTFARPIHWILARFGGEEVSFPLGDVVSGGVTCGHRFLAPQPVEVKDAEAYLAALQGAHVIVDPSRRRAYLEAELAKAAASVGGEVVPNPGLVEENTFLVELPSVVVGNFEELFLALPDEVLITSMREHQRYFSLRGKDGKLLPHFIAVNNTLTRDPEVVARGHERVLRARLADAMYFFQTDSKVKLETWVEELKGVVFHSALGTSYEKMGRFRALADYLQRHLESEDAGRRPMPGPEAVQRAAFLCKADIVSEMVGEFPSLQGVMGKVYALQAGEEPAVAEAVFTHYLPRHAGDDLPEDALGCLVGLADRLDTICGLFGVGLTPTGAADPYGLRRHALAVINILLARRLHLDLPEALAAALGLLEGKITRAPEETALELLDFFQTRLQHLLLGEGFDHETVAAVLSAGCRDVVEAADKVKALHEVRQSPEFPALAVAFKRVINISLGAEGGEVNEMLFEHPEERLLAEMAALMETEVDQALAGRDYAGACRSLTRLKGPVDAFFDRVLVMAEDPALRRNRLALLRRISDNFLKMADFSRITT
ncbi:MAG: glycine--tRNA ligase subunit beta [Deltaproteobacteria bacterium]|nr:glycine--tRNA ligase subunit beta [Deltaproteobacteria bacterium]